MTERKKKILFIIVAMGDGIFTYIVDITNKLLNKYDMYIAYALQRQTPAIYKEYFYPRIHFIKVENFARFINPTKKFKAMLEMKKIKEEKKLDIIHLNPSKKVEHVNNGIKTGDDEMVERAFDDMLSEYNTKVMGQRYSTIYLKTIRWDKLTDVISFPANEMVVVA